MKTQSLDEKVNSMFKYILQKSNPFDMIPNPLHNLVTNALVSQDKGNDFECVSNW